MDDPDHVPAATAPTWAVGDLTATIGEQVRGAFPEEVWVRGEIQDLRRARSGHVYFSLRHLEADGDAGAHPPQLPVMLSSRTKDRVNRLLRRSGGAVRMTDGTEVRIRGRVDVWEPRAQVQLRMTSIDPAFTLGQLAAARAELVAALAAEGLLRANAAVPMPVLPLRVGLVTSSGSAAEADVLDTLLASGFAFRVTVADVRVQGPDAPVSVAAAIGGLSRAGVDVIVLARGGGAQTDLAAFDTELVARAVATATRPVVCGVGHETDRPLVEEVAQVAAKTPTAAAQHLVGLVAGALERAESAWAGIAVRAEHVLTRAEDRLDRARTRAAGAARSATARELARVEAAPHRLRRAASARLDAADATLDGGRRRLLDAPERRLERAAGRLDVLAARTVALDPARALARGWSLTRDGDGRLVRSVADVAPGTVLATTVTDGEVRSTVERTEVREEQA